MSDPPRIVVLDAPQPGRARNGIAIELRAGYGATAEAVPATLRLAIRSSSPVGSRTAAMLRASRSSRPKRWPSSRRFNGRGCMIAFPLSSRGRAAEPGIHNRYHCRRRRDVDRPFLRRRVYGFRALATLAPERQWESDFHPKDIAMKTKSLSIGARARRFVLELPLEQPDGFGGVIRTYAPGPQLWGAIEMLSGTERVRADRPEQA